MAFEPIIPMQEMHKGLLCHDVACILTSNPMGLRQMISCLSEDTMQIKTLPYQRAVFPSGAIGGYRQRMGEGRTP